MSSESLCYFSTCTSTMQIFCFPELKLNIIRFIWVSSSEIHCGNTDGTCQWYQLQTTQCHQNSWLLIMNITVKRCVCNCCCNLYNYLFLILGYGKKWMPYLWCSVRTLMLTNVWWSMKHVNCTPVLCSGSLSVPSAFSTELGDNSDTKVVWSEHLLPRHTRGCPSLTARGIHDF